MKNLLRFPSLIIMVMVILFRAFRKVKMEYAIHQMADELREFTNGDEELLYRALQIVDYKMDQGEYKFASISDYIDTVKFEAVVISSGGL